MSTTTANGAVRSQTGGRNLANLALRLRVTGVLVFLILLCIFFSLTTSTFFQAQNARIIAFNAAILVIAACAEAIVVLTRNLDLSIGATMGLAGYVTADFAARNPGIGPELVILALVLGALLGLVNGLLVSYGKLPSIIATLGTMSVYRGITYIYARGQQVTATQLPPWMLKGVDAMVFGIPSLVLVAVFTVALVAFFLHYAPLGRTIYAVGSNPAAGHFYGLRTDRIVLFAYVFCGTLAGLAGFLYAARVGTVTVILASGWEMTALAAVVIGGVSILGGSGNIVGVAIGALVLATIDNGLVLMGMPEFWRMFIQGTAIVLAVTVDSLIEGRIQAIFKGKRRLGQQQ